MALSFGRKKGEATNEANNSPASLQTKSGAIDEPIDESWFETFSEEAAAQSATPRGPISSAPASGFSTSAPASSPDFSVFDTDAPEDLGDFGTKVDIPQSTPSPLSPGSGASTPFDLPAAPTHTPVPATETSLKKGGGLKKVLPLLAVLLILGGGGAFWFSQQGNNTEEVDSSMPANPVASAPPAAPITGAPPASSAPPATQPTGAAPETASPANLADPKIKAQLKDLWNEGVALHKQKKDSAAKAKWGAAVRLARSKPGFAKSADMIQQAIDKLK